jgi:hypothetical protein
MSDPFSHNNFPGATARRPRPAKTKKPNTLKNNNSTDPDWFSNMEQTPPANAVSAVNVFSSKPKPPGVNSNVHAGRSRGIGIGGTNRGPKPPSRAKPPSKAKPPSRAKPKSSKGPGSTASGSNNNHNDNKNNNTFPRPPQTSRNQTQYNTETNFTTSDTGPTSSATYGSGMTNSQNYNSYSQQHQQQPYQQSYHQQQQQHQQQPSSISSFSSVPGMFNPTLPPMQMSGKMGEPVNQNTPLPIQQTQHSQQPKPSQTAISSVTQQHAFNNFSAPPAMLPGNFNPPAATTTNDSISGSMGNTSVRSATGNFDFSDEPPLLEELGVDMRRILSKTLAVVNPFKKIDTAVMTAQDSDLAGPVIFAITLGALLMFQGTRVLCFLFNICFSFLLTYPIFLICLFCFVFFR